jgi:hypothetical protein
MPVPQKPLATASKSAYSESKALDEQHLGPYLNW